MSTIFGNGKDNSIGSHFDIDTDLSTLNSKLVDETINSCSNILNSSVSKTVNCGSSLLTPLKLVKNTIKGKTLKKS